MRSLTHNERMARHNKSAPEEPEGVRWLSVRNHEQAKRSVQRSRSLGALLGFVGVFLVLSDVQPLLDALAGALAGAFAGYLLGWWVAQIWWMEALRLHYQEHFGSRKRATETPDA